ncbi:MAG: MFS transporter [Agarilytica sp.]
MCFGFLGIQFGFALQNANVSRIFQTLGASIDEIPLLWIAAPVTGLIVQPIVGYFSDRTWTRLGRRRPYFLYGALVASVALIFMPDSPSLWIAAGTLWIMDASINVSMEPFRAFVGDMLPQKQRPLGYAMQSFFIGLGAIVASTLPWMMSNWFDVSNVAAEGQVPDSVKYSFRWGGAVFLLAVMWTVFSTKEYSPEKLRSFSSEEDSQNDDTEVHIIRSGRQYQNSALVWALVSILSSIGIYSGGWDAQLYIISVGIGVVAVIQFWVARMKLHAVKQNAVCEVADDFFLMPKTMKQLAVVQFFSWFALFSMWIYATPAVTHFHFGATDASSAVFNRGADWVGVLFGSYNGFAALAAFLIPVLANRFGLRVAHMIGLCFGGVGLISFVVIKDPNWLLLSMVGVGFAWASILSVPYAILSSAVPLQKMGVYMGLFNFFIVVPQILAASVLGLFVKYLFNGQAINALLLGGALMICAAISMFFVDVPGEKRA